MKPIFPLGREPFNGWSHLLAMVAAVLGAVMLAKSGWSQDSLFFAKIFYSITLIFAFGSSALYHLAVTTSERLRILRNFDHLCIRALMIGTFAPLSVAMLPAGWDLVYLGAFLVSVIIGMFLTRRVGRNAHSFSYIVLACLPLIAVPFLWNEHWRNILWVSFGSCFYVLGAFCYIKKFPKRNRYLKFHGAWHVCVILGSLVHFLVIYHL